MLASLRPDVAIHAVRIPLISPLLAYRCRIGIVASIGISGNLTEAGGAKCLTQTGGNMC